MSHVEIASSNVTGAATFVTPYHLVDCFTAATGLARLACSEVSISLPLTALRSDLMIGHASLCYSAEDKDSSTSPRGSPVASYVPRTRLPIASYNLLTPFDITRIEPPSTSTVNATSEFRKIRQSLSLLESHLTTMQRAPRPPPDAPLCETRTQPQRGLLAHLSAPLSSWPTQLNPGVGPTGWISYLGMRVSFIFASNNEPVDSFTSDAWNLAAPRSARRITVGGPPESESAIG